MKAYSTIEPDSIFIESTQNGYRVRLRKNIEQYTEEFEGETQMMFKYDEVVLELSETTDINSYVTNNFDELFNMGQQQEYSQKINVIKDYYNNGDITDTDLDYYVSSGMINAKSEITG
jgi:hypothetical protein